MLEDRRISTRRRVLRRASIVFGKGQSVIACVMLDVSAGGARLKVGEWLTLPDRFELRIENGPRREAEVRFRAMEMTGIEFTDELAA